MQTSTAQLYLFSYVIICVKNICLYYLYLPFTFIYPQDKIQNVHIDFTRSHFTLIVPQVSFKLSSSRKQSKYSNYSWTYDIPLAVKGVNVCEVEYNYTP